jgi:hypothetical protein
MPRRWEPSAGDATSLAAFRWFANTIENFAIELYATDRRSYEDVEIVLRNTLKDLKGIRANFAVSQEENGCPDGYVLCDGVCAPSCDFEAGEITAASSVSSGGKNAKKKGKKR